MYSSRGNGAYGQQQQPKPQPYSGQSSFGQNGPDGSRHSAVLGSHPSAGAHYGGQYTSVYGSQTDTYDHLDAAAGLRQELLQTRSLQSASVDGSSRQADYLAARSATVHPGQELLPYGRRYDTDLHALSSTRGTQHAPSILEAAPRREAEDLMYVRGSANPSYVVSLPPGRAYVSGKSLHGTSLESDYLGGVLSRAAYSRLDDRKDDVAYAREVVLREENRRWEILRERERELEVERERMRERERILERLEWERERESRQPGTYSRRESSRPHSPVKGKRREYVCKDKSASTKTLTSDHVKLESGTTRRNAKLAIREGRVGKLKSKGKDKKDKGKALVTPKAKPSKDDKCFHCDEAGHWKRNCPKYLAELKLKSPLADKSPSAEESPSETKKDDKCFYCDEVGHWKRNCPKYLAELKLKKLSAEAEESPSVEESSSDQER